MLPRAYRLPLKTEFKRLQKEGSIFQGTLFGLLLFQKDTTDSPPRFATIVSNKIHKKAVARNKIRRLISESLWQLWPWIKTGVEGVFLVKKPIIQASLNQIKKEMEVIFKKANCLERQK